MHSFNSGYVDASALVPGSANFLRLWKVLRGTRLIPTLDAWLGGVTASFTDFNFRAEVSKDDVTILFVGSELLLRRGVNMTGKSLYAREAHRREPGTNNMHTVTRKPCGFVIGSEYRSTADRKMIVQLLFLPLEVGPNRPPQVVGYSGQLSERYPDETIASEAIIQRRHWLDIGAGVPGYAPS